MSDLITREAVAAWDLRGAWASRAVVVLALDESCRPLERVAGWVERVSPTNAIATLETIEGEELTVQCVTVLSVRRPHFHEPADAEALSAPRRPRRETVLDVFPGQLGLFDTVTAPSFGELA